MRAESIEEATKIIFEIADSSQTIVCRMDCPASKGIHRVTWNFRCTAIPAHGPSPLCAPGNYSVQAKVLRDGELQSLTAPVEFVVESIVDPTLALQERDEVLEFIGSVSQTANTANALRTKLAQRLEQIRAARDTLGRSNTSTAQLIGAAKQIETEAQELDLRINGDPNKRFYSVDSEPTIADRLNNVLYGTANSTHGPTLTHREQFEIAKKQLADLASEFKNFEAGVESFFEQLDDAQIPWTPGRQVRFGTE